MYPSSSHCLPKLAPCCTSPQYTLSRVCGSCYHVLTWQTARPPHTTAPEQGHALNAPQHHRTCPGLATLIMRLRWRMHNQPTPCPVPKACTAAPGRATFAASASRSTTASRARPPPSLQLPQPSAQRPRPHMRPCAGPHLPSQAAAPAAPGQARPQPSCGCRGRPPRGHAFPSTPMPGRTPSPCPAASALAQQSSQQLQAWQTSRPAAPGLAHECTQQPQAWLTSRPAAPGLAQERTQQPQAWPTSRPAASGLAYQPRV